MNSAGSSKEAARAGSRCCFYYSSLHRADNALTQSRGVLGPHKDTQPLCTGDAVLYAHLAHKPGYFRPTATALMAIIWHKDDISIQKKKSLMLINNHHHNRNDVEKKYWILFRFITNRILQNAKWRALSTLLSDFLFFFLYVCNHLIHQIGFKTFFPMYPISESMCFSSGVLIVDQCAVEERKVGPPVQAAAAVFPIACKLYCRHTRNYDPRVSLKWEHET